MLEGVSVCAFLLVGKHALAFGRVMAKALRKVWQGLGGDLRPFWQVCIYNGSCHHMIYILNDSNYAVNILVY